MSRPAVIFDFDYTLADSSQGVVECIRYALEALGLPPISADRACRTIGLSLPDTFTELTGQRDVAQSAAFARLFVARAAQVMVDGTAMFEAVPDVIRQLNVVGCRLAIVSTKYRHRIEAILKRDGLRGAFVVIVGGEDVAAHKPDPEGLLRAMAALGSTPPGTLYVGDSVTDARAAARAGVPFVAVLSGTTPREAFAGSAARWLIEDLSELPGLIASERFAQALGTDPREQRDEDRTQVRV